VKKLISHRTFCPMADFMLLLHFLKKCEQFVNIKIPFKKLHYFLFPSYL